MSRVCIIGLDSLAPQLVFERFWDDLPHLRRLAAGGRHARLRSCEPPITVPAWAAMVTGCDPGALGVYGFYDRADRSYGRRRLASSASYAQPTVWELLSAAGQRSRLVGIPQTYPPRPFAGALVCGLLTPPDAGVVAVPAAAAAEARRVLRGAPLDVEDFRSLPPAALVRQVRRGSRRLFALARAWAARSDWALLMLVDMGPDRLQHALWRHCLPDHPRYAPHHPQAAALHAYHVLLDGEVGRLLGCLRPDDLVLVVSDHGAQPMHGALALNDWLLDMGDLRLLGGRPRQPTRLDVARVDWPRTRAWAEGGYVGRLNLNVAGREPQGVVPPAAIESELQRLQAGLAAIGGGAHVGRRPHDVFATCRGVPPDLWVYADGLKRRCLGSIGHPSWLPEDNDRGPDGANHAHEGLLVMGGGGVAARPGMAPTVSIYDVAPTVLKHLRVPIPASMGGRSLV